MGKWDKLRGKFETRPLTNEGGFREKVGQVKDEHKDDSLELLLELFDQADKEKERHEEAIKEQNVEIEALDQLIRENLESQELRAVESAVGHIYKIDIKPYPSINDKVGFEKFVDENPQLEYLWSIQPSSFAAWVKDLLDQGRDAEVPSSVSVFLKSSIKLTRRKA